MTAQFREVGRTENTDYFVAADDVLIVMPRTGTVDDAASAAANVEFQLGYARKLGKKIGTVVHLPGLLSQDSGARKIYANDMDPELVYGAALIVSNALSRAIGSFFLGLTKPKFPTRLFDNVDNAIAWLEQQRPEGKP